MNEIRKNHWEKVYETKSPNEVSWTQEIPKISLELIAQLNLPKDAKIIDIGGGDSNFVDFLLKLGYTDISVLDISKNAIEKAKIRLGSLAEKITWIVSDILDFKPTELYDLWHDRATFHFLTQENEIQKYVECVNKFVIRNIIIGTFSDNGPLKCSGLEIKQYNEQTLKSVFSENFNVTLSLENNHETPFNTTQNFIFASLTIKLNP